MQTELAKKVTKLVAEEGLTLDEAREFFTTLRVKMSSIICAPMEGRENEPLSNHLKEIDI